LEISGERKRGQAPALGRLRVWRAGPIKRWAFREMNH
jgi:hypothetical protein